VEHAQIFPIALPALTAIIGESLMEVYASPVQVDVRLVTIQESVIPVWTLII